MIRLHTYMGEDISERKKSIVEIIEEYQVPLKAFISSRLASEEDAEDLLQEVWYQLSKTIQKEEIKNVRAWIYRVARNKIIDSYRKKSADWLEDYVYEDEEGDAYLIDSLLESDESPEMDFIRERFWEDMYEALDALPEKQREVFILNEWEGVTLREIAERRGEKLKTIISRKGYAVRYLREQLELIFEEFFGVD
ncbi:MAG: sigma-70 family RNA polymerase sigma factor [Bacteroidota bacterium]